jgi:WD40 repeat protein
VLARFADYELLEEIARGGMGIVYKARQVSLNRLVALKMILSGQFASKQEVLRFRVEAEAAANLRHPNIVAIYETGEHQGQHFFSMEYVAGPNLSQLVGNRPLNAQLAARYTLGIARAIHYAHGQNTLHRDLKPSNVLVDADDQPRITDFGLMRRLRGPYGLTMTGQMLGSPNFMPPEQCGSGSTRDSRVPSGNPPDGNNENLADRQGCEETINRSLVACGGSPRAAGQWPALPRERAGPWSDVYGIGAILYHLLTARPPFQAETVHDVLLQLREQDPVAPRLLNRSIPRDLETICLKCLEKAPDQRYATANELADDLERFLHNEPIRARPVGRAERAWRWCRRKPALASFIAATSFLLLTILIGSPIAIFRINQARRAEQVQLKRAEAEALRARQNLYAAHMNLAQRAVQEDDFYGALQLLERQRPTNTFGKSEFRNRKSESKNSDRPSTINSQLSTDLRGWEWRYLWKQCQGEERFILWEQTNAAMAVSSAGLISAGLSADGKTVFSACNEPVVRLFDLESRREVARLPHSERVVGAAASPDGRWLATTTEKSDEPQPVLLWSLATLKVEAIFATNFCLRPRSIIFSPDSQWLAFGTVFDGIRLWDVKARSEITNLPAFQPRNGPLALAFSPDGRQLAYSENDLGVIALWDISSRSLVGHLTNHQDFVMALAFSPDGQTLASGGQDRTAKVWNLTDRQVRFTITNDSGGVISLAFSPDGRTLAVGASGGNGRIIRLVDVETGLQTGALRGHRLLINSLAFTTSYGRTLISASADGTIRVWDTVPRPKEKLAHLFARDSISTAWLDYGPAVCLSSDGRHLLTVYTNQTFSLWDTLRFEEGERYPLPSADTSCAAVAPGGKLAAFGSCAGELLLWDVEAGQKRFSARPTTNGVCRLAFSPDGRQVASASDNNAIRVWDVSTLTETNFFSTAGESPMSLAFSADGRVLMAGFTGPVKLWRLDRPSAIATFRGHDLEVRGLALLPDGQTLISSTADICFWDVRTRQETYKIPGGVGPEGAIALSADGRRLAAAGGDGLIVIYDVASHEEVARLPGHKEFVSAMAFTPDGDHLVSVSKKQLRVWRAASLAEADSTPGKSSRP